ncbi:MAG: hypothetical protein AABY37_01835 [Actinomycetota bacterium]
MIYATILVAALLAISIARILFLNAEIKTIDMAGVKFHALIASWEAQYPIDYTTPETYAASKEKMPKELAEAETEYAWATNARDSKKESRTIWYGFALLSLVALVTASIELIRNSN